MVTPTDLPKPDFSQTSNNKPSPRGPPSPSKHPRPTTPQDGDAARQSMETSREINPPKVRRLLLDNDISDHDLLIEQTETLAKRMPEEVQRDIVKQSKILQSSRKLTQMTKERPLFPFSMSAENQNDVYLTKGMEGGDVVFKPGPVAMLNKMCDGIARMLGLGSSIPPAKAGHADVVSKRDVHVDSRKKETVYKDYHRLTNLNGEEVLVDLKSEEIVKVKNVSVKGDQATCTIEGRNVLLVPKEDGSGLEVCDPSARKTDIEKAAEKSNQFVVLNREDDEEAVFLAPKASLGQVTDHKTLGKIAKIDNYIYKVVDVEGEDTCRLEDLNIGPNKGKSPDKELLGQEFAFMEMADEAGDVEDVLVPTNVLVELEEPPFKGGEATSFSFGGKAFEAIEIKGKPGTYKIAALGGEIDKEELPFEGETATLVEDQDGQYYLLPKEEESVIVQEEAESGGETEEDWEKTSEPKEYVIRNGQKYEIVETDNGYHVVGHNIRGMVQFKVENIFTKPSAVKRDFDIKKKGKANEAMIEEFFQRIDMKGFVDAFLLTLLIRPQDGRIDDLANSNVLFQAIDKGDERADPLDPSVKLRPVLIDLDETMPASNAYSLHPDFLEDGWDKVHCVRCGLMAFPQARKPLSKEERKWINEFANTLAAKKRDLEAYLKTYANQSSTFRKENVAAFLEVVNETLSYIHDNKRKEWTLEDLFFHVFPEYKKQWDMLEDDPPEMKAFQVGFQNEPDLSPRSRKS